VEVLPESAEPVGPLLELAEYLEERDVAELHGGASQGVEGDGLGRPEGGTSGGPAGFAFRARRELATAPAAGCLSGSKSV
jgi:hypothetical protein